MKDIDGNKIHYEINLDDELSEKVSYFKKLIIREHEISISDNFKLTEEGLYYPMCFNHTGL